ncbi:MAG TPA: MarR family transcriptional regulator [Mycobacteriales bacterium]
MSPTSTPAYRFGDLLALARQSWLTQMARALQEQGYTDYRRSDAQVLRLLRRGPRSIGQLGEALGVTRQAARKVATGLERRGYATAIRDDRDARQVNLSLTPAGEAYAGAVVEVIDRLNRSLRRRVPAADLAAADRVLRAVLADEHTRALAAYLPPPT